MTGTMMATSLTIPSILDHAKRYHGSGEIISVNGDGTVERSNWREVWQGAKRLASALHKLDVQAGERVSTIAWNNRRHLEIYFGVAGAGMVCHTINPRLFPEQLVYIINHAEDAVLCFDETFLPLVANIRDKLTTVRHFVLMSSSRPEELHGLDVLLYDELSGSESAEDDWADIDEWQPSSLCYTSGTTGHPKGVLYSHRSTVLHSLGGNQPDGLNIAARDSVLPVVPMFHVSPPYGRGC